MWLVPGHSGRFLAIFWDLAFQDYQSLKILSAEELEAEMVVPDFFHTTALVMLPKRQGPNSTLDSSLACRHTSLRFRAY